MYRDDEMGGYYSTPQIGVDYVEESPRSRVYIPAIRFPNPAGRAEGRRCWNVPNALYRLYGATELLYVGIARHPNLRWNNHSLYKEWWSEVVTRTVDWFDNRTLAEIAEYVAITTENPLHNVDRRPIKVRGHWAEAEFRIFNQLPEEIRALSPVPLR